MRLDVFGGGVVDANAYKGWPGLIFNSCAYRGPAPWGGGMLCHRFLQWLPHRFAP